MDAWLPHYIRDPRGANLLIVRNPEIFPALLCEKITCTEVDLGEVIASQREYATPLKRKQV